MAPSDAAVPMAASPATPAPMTRTLAGGTLPAARDLAGEEPPEPVAGLDDGPVSGDVGHRGQDVHLLGAADSRHHIHGDGVRAGGFECFEKVGILRRPEKAYHGLTGAKLRFFLLRHAADLDDDVSLFPKGRRGPGDGRAASS